jgi:hypothetical protein
MSFFTCTVVCIDQTTSNTQVLSIAGQWHRGRCHFWHLSSVLEHSGTGRGPFDSFTPGTGLVPASAFLIIPVQDWPDAGHYSIPAIRKPYKMERNLPCTSKRLLLVLYYDVENHK